MGTMRALGFSGAVKAGQITLEVALEDHLRYGHFPPVSQDFIPTCLRAIECANTEEFDTEIEMPNGITKTAGEICDGLHLWAFIDDGGEDESATTERIPEMGLAFLRIDGCEMLLPMDARTFKTGSRGFYGQTVINGAEGRQYQVGITAVLIGSKPKEES